MKKVLFSLLGLIVMSGCTHTHKVDGQQVKSEIPEGVRVRIGSPEVREGDRVSVLKSVCRESLIDEKFGAKRSCKREQVGEASVLKVLDGDSAVVQADSGVRIDDTMFVEAKSK